ncbi:MAG: carbamoyltransferase HypF [Nitrospirae bacterium]|nr:carbamoyltransferase HypF [Nitrospirota bacterium]
MDSRVKILVRGIVQGVGFRPFVYSLAKSLNLKGFVMNSSKGVTIEIEGNDYSLFIERLKHEAPPLSNILSIDVIPLPFYGYGDFRIVESEDEGSFTLVSPDVSICKDCFKELLDVNNRRYLYPFINCTNCGPRYTITKSVPYDRPNTTMSVFKMCFECDEEYHNPEDRRFHAQPNACPLCGPHVELIVKNKKGKASILNNPSIIKRKENPIEKTIRFLKEGYIVAIKGLGGFHLACDASNKDAVNKLRLRKRKSNKPFALMAPDIETIRKFCEVSEKEEKLLLSNKRPIVLLKKKGNYLPEEVSPKNPYLGFMLPYTPLHYLLFYYPLNFRPQPTNSKLQNNFDALIMTSGNLSEEPIVIDNEEAISSLSDISDAFLIHNRDIFMRVDDSVVKVFIHEPYPHNKQIEILTHNTQSFTLFIRRSRGYVPDPIFLHEEGPEVLGCGADIKNTFTLTKGSFAIPSQHIGDMENYETLRFFEESLENLKKVYRVNPEALAYDLHPVYLSTRWALKQDNIKKFGIQHHFAHIASVMAERGITEDVIGISFDGTGYGIDGNLWGGEFLIADINGFKRAGHFKYIPLPGGEIAVKEPWRTAISYIWNTTREQALDYLKHLGFIDRYGIEQINKILGIIDKKEFSPLSSGAGRFFDAVSAILGICDKNTFEGEAAIALESITRQDVFDDYTVNIISKDPLEIDFSLTILGIIEDFLKGEDKGTIASKFHNTIASVIFRVVQKLSSSNNPDIVILSGGVFQNMYLLERAVSILESAGKEVYTNTKVPCNDAGISLGQAYVIREWIKSGKSN